MWCRFIQELGFTDKEFSDDQYEVLIKTIRTVAQSLDLSGAQIKYAVLSAMFSSRRASESLSMKHILRGLDSELMKSGRMLSDKEISRITAYDQS